jgi:hypothetical protein
MHTNIESNTLTKKSPHLIALIVARSEVIDIISLCSGLPLRSIEDWWFKYV